MAALDARTQRDISRMQLEQEGEEEKKKLLEGQISILRLLLAGVARIALIGPILLMTLHPGRNTSLITTVAVVLSTLGFGFSKGGPQNVFLGSAAYAAVLIMFVGANLAPGASTCICTT